MVMVRYGREMLDFFLRQQAAIVGAGMYRLGVRGYRFYSDRDRLVVSERWSNKHCFQLLEMVRYNVETLLWASGLIPEVLPWCIHVSLLSRGHGCKSCPWLKNRGFGSSCAEDRYFRALQLVGDKYLTHDVYERMIRRVYEVK